MNKFLNLANLVQFKSHITNLLNKKTDTFQGIENSGKIMTVGKDGNLEPTTISYKIQVISQSEYDSLVSPDSSTLYVIEV